MKNNTDIVTYLIEVESMEDEIVIGDRLIEVKRIYIFIE